MPQRRLERAPSRVDSAVQVALVVAAVAPFLGTLLYGYVYDDTSIILHNPAIVGWGSLIRVWKEPYWANGGRDFAGLYRPLLMAIFAVIWNGAHRFAIAFHVYVVALHALATILTWRLLQRGAGRWPAAAGALWFALQPVHVEAVANIANSSETLVGVWTLMLALLLMPAESANGEANTSAADRRRTAPRWRRALAAAAVYAAALLTKESGAVALALALIALWGWAPADSEAATPTSAATGDDVRRTARAWLPAFVLWAAVLCAVAIVRRVVLGGFVSATSIAAPGIAGLTGVQRAWAMLSLGGRVGRLLFWPGVQNPHYGPSVLPPTPGPTLAAFLTLAVLVAAGSAAWWLARRATSRDRRPLAAIAWCLIAFLPASNLFVATGQILAERTLYLSSIGVAMLVAWGLDRLLAGAKSRQSHRAQSGAAQRQRVQWAAAGAAVAMTLACARDFIHTRDYAAVWRTHRDLFSQMVRADSLSYHGYQLLAVEYENEGHLPEADSLYARGYALYPRDRHLLTDYGEYLLGRKRPVEALAMGTALLGYADMRTDPRAVTLYLNAMDRVWGVDSTLAAARRLTAQTPSARSELFVGLALEAKGDSAGARAAFADGLRLAPTDSALLAHAAAPRR